MSGGSGSSYPNPEQIWKVTHVGEACNNFQKLTVCQWMLRCCWIPMDKNDFGPEFCIELAKVSWFFKTLLLSTKNTFLTIAQRNLTQEGCYRHRRNTSLWPTFSQKMGINVPIENEKSRWLILPHGSFYPTFPCLFIMKWPFIIPGGKNIFKMFRYKVPLLLIGFNSVFGAAK